MPVAELKGQGAELMGLFFNPNVQPYTENQRRLETCRDWAEGSGLRLIVQEEYDPESWLRQMAFRESTRCRICYHQRLTRTAQVAKRGGFDAFSTTLLYSVRQKHDLIVQIARSVADKEGVEFHYQDFRPFWKQGIARSKELGLYRQQYCGCIYSERERYLGPKRAKPGSGPAKNTGERQKS